MLEPCGKPLTVPELLDTISDKLNEARSLAEDTADALEGPPPPMPCACDAVPKSVNPDNVISKLINIDERMNRLIDTIHRARRIVMP